MADALDAQGGCVVRLLPATAQGQAPRVVTLAAVLDGQMLPNDEYTLAGTPSLLLMSQRTHVVADKVQQLYPEAPILAKVGAQAYAGQQLCNANGEVVGIVFVLFRQAIAETDFITSTLQIFASRASAEIERQLADARIRHQASLLDKAQDAIVVRDLEPSMGAEDFSFMLQTKPGAYLRLGQGTGASGSALHNSRYDFNDEILPLGSALHASLIEQAMPLPMP